MFIAASEYQGNHYLSQTEMIARARASHPSHQQSPQGVLERRVRF